MTSGSALGTVAVLCLAWSPSYAMFFAAWVLAGVASAGLFYAPAFAAPHRLVRRPAGAGDHHPHSGRRILQHHLRPTD